MGLLTAITIGLALLADFLLLPTLLMTLDNKDTYESNRLADSAQSTA
jgi:multisubunit Na+/H+ antiporter MnhC subunit